MIKHKNNGEKGNWFLFPCLTVKSVWKIFCNELFVMWFACLQTDIMWGTLAYSLLKSDFFLSFLFHDFVLCAVIETGHQGHLMRHCEEICFSMPGAGSRREGRKRLGCSGKNKIIMTRYWHDRLVTKKPNWILKSSLLVLTLKPKLTYLHRLLNV